jgi:hypothetical protein
VQSFLGLSPAGLITVFYWLKCETPRTWTSRSQCLYSPGTWWPSYTPMHCVSQNKLKSKSKSKSSDSCFFFPYYGAPSLMRGRICHFSVTGCYSSLSVCIWVFHFISLTYKLLYIKSMYALLIVAHTTMAVETLALPYTWSPPSLRFLYILCWASPCPILQTFSF